MIRTLLVASAVLWARQSPAQSPAVGVSGPPGTYISSAVLTASGPVPLLGTWSGPGGLYTVAAPPGVVVTQTDTSVTFSWAPAPVPAPPAPQPPAPPNTGPYFLAMVTDRTGTIPLTPSQVALATSPTIRASLKAINPANQWAAPLDVSTPTLAGWVPAIRAAGMPCVLILSTTASGSGFRVETIAQPADEASVLAEVRRLAAGGAPR